MGQQKKEVTESPTEVIIQSWNSNGAESPISMKSYTTAPSFPYTNKQMNRFDLDTTKGVQELPVVGLDTVARPLYPHQKTALLWTWENDRSRIALFMEMRLGKSKVIIERCRNFKSPNLIIAPLSTLRSWENELMMEGEFEIQLLLGTKKQREDKMAIGCKWNLINFEGLRACPKILENKWRSVIVDESSKLRNPQTKTSKAICSMFQNVPTKAILSGLPAPESPLDYFQQFKFLQGHFMGFDNFWSFRNTAFYQPYKYKWLPKSGWKEKIKDYVQSNSFVLSRNDAGMGNQKVYEQRSITLDPEQKRLMEKVEKEFVLETGKEELETKWIPVTWIWLAQLSGGFVDGELKFPGKINELISLLQGELKNDSVVVWFRFNQELRAVSKELEDRGITCPKLWGEMDESGRWDSIKKFKGGSVRVLLCQQKVGLYGIDLSSASTAIYYSNGFSSETRNQSEDRIEHPSKKEPLLIIDLVTRNSMDEDIVKALKRKEASSKYFLRNEVLRGMERRVA